MSRGSLYAPGSPDGLEGLWKLIRLFGIRRSFHLADAQKSLLVGATSLETSPLWPGLRCGTLGTGMGAACHDDSHVSGNVMS